MPQILVHFVKIFEKVWIIIQIFFIAFGLFLFFCYTASSFIFKSVYNGLMK